MNHTMAIPTALDSQQAEESFRKLNSIEKSTIRTLTLQTGNVGQDQSINIPLPMIDLIESILANIAQGNAITIVPAQAELTTQEAADILNVSRPFIIQLIESQKLPFHTIGIHRYVQLADVLEFKRRNHEARLKTLEELARHDQELGLGY